MKCPECSSSGRVGRMRTLETRENGGKLYRRRECVACGVRMVSIETLTTETSIGAFFRYPSLKKRAQLKAESAANASAEKTWDATSLTTIPWLGAAAPPAQQPTGQTDKDDGLSSGEEDGNG